MLRSTFARALPLVVVLSSLSCGDAQPPPDGPEPLGTVSQAAGTVVDALTTGCSTTSVRGLSVQIVGEMNCIVPNAVAEVPTRPNLAPEAVVFPFLQTAARNQLVQALDDHPSTNLQVSSMLRTVAQQYLLYQWYLAGDCAIGLAASPGNSNHEQGLSLDTNNYSTWDSILSSYGWDWYGSSDPFHFTYTGSGSQDLDGVDVAAFQRLWNRNHPDDFIEVDGDYGPETQNRLEASPADGFALGYACGPALDATLVAKGSDAAPDGTGAADFVACPNQSLHLWFEVRNTGFATWVDVADSTEEHWGRSVRLGTTDDQPDPLSGLSRLSLTESSNARVAPSGATPAPADCSDQPGCSRTRFTPYPGFAATAPSTMGTYRSEWQLLDETRQRFGPVMQIAVRVVDCTDAGPPPMDATSETSIPEQDAWVDDSAADSHSPYVDGQIDAPTATPDASGTDVEEGDNDAQATGPSGSRYQASSDSGCGCRQASGAKDPSMGWMMVVALVLGGVRRRSRLLGATKQP